MRARQSGWLVAVGVGCLLAATGAQAQTNTDRPGSILMFPKVVNDGARDTIIQITNTGNSLNTVHCMYLNGAPGRTGAPLCSETDFDISLTRQQPTQWTVSTGRRVNPSDGLGTAGAGYDPGLVPPVAAGFTGGLVCVEVLADGSLAPLAQNKLKGEATLLRSSDGDVSKYNAVAVPVGVPGPNLDTTLSLNDAEYARCPTDLRLNFIPDDSLDPVIETYNASGASSVVTNLTLMPCGLDFRNGVRTSGTVNFNVWDEFEVTYSGSFSYGCWTSFNIGTLAQFRSLLGGGNIPTLYANAILTPTGSPVVGVAESFHGDSQGVTAAAAVDLHGTIGTTNANIVLP